MLDIIRTNIEALKILNLPTKHWDVLIIHIISEKLDFAWQKKWQQTLTSDLPKYSNFLTILQKRCQILESLSGLSKGANSTKTNPNNNKNLPTKILRFVIIPTL